MMMPHLVRYLKGIERSCVALCTFTHSQPSQPKGASCTADSLQSELATFAQNPKNHA
jgi:hypothetical protein